MDFRVLLPIVFVCFMTAPLSAEPIAASKPQFESRSESEQRAIDVLHEWNAENLTCTSLRGDFQRIWYDDIFQVQEHSKGQFGYLGPRHGFWRSRPPEQNPNVASLKKNSDGKPYTYKLTESGELRFQKTRWVCINEETKSYLEWIYANQPKQQSSWGLFDFLYDMAADWPSPFLPGVPNQERFDGLLKRCHFKVVKETETHIRISGKPQSREDAANYSEFKLYLEKRPWRLRGTQYIHPGGNQSTVYCFSNIETNPSEWDEPILTGYLNQADHPVIARRPEPVLQKSGEERAN